MIEQLLPKYYHVFGTNPTHSVLRTISIEDHEIAWMKFTGTVELGANTGQVYTGRTLFCECDFTEGVGWETKGDKFHKILGPAGTCLYRRVAVYLRHLELRQEYEARGFNPLGLSGCIDLAGVMLDLMKKAKKGEFIEDGAGARFWNGHFYLQTVADITDEPMKDIWRVARELQAKHKIAIEGSIVQTYQKPRRKKKVA